MSISCDRVVNAPIAVVREELTRIVWEKRPDLVPREAQEKWLGLTQGNIGHRSFGLAYEREWNRMGIALHGSLREVNQGSTHVRYRCGIMDGRQIAAFLMVIAFVAMIASASMGFALFAGALFVGQFAWMVRRDRRINRSNSACASYLADRIDHALSEAETRGSGPAVHLTPVAADEAAEVL